MIQIEDLRRPRPRKRHRSAPRRALNVTPPALSIRLRKLEATLADAGDPDRALPEPHAGRRALRRAGAALLAQLEALPESFQREDQRLTGTLRIAAPFGYGRRHVAPLLAQFARQHPPAPAARPARDARPDRHDSDAVIHVGKVRDSSGSRARWQRTNAGCARAWPTCARTARRPSRATCWRTPASASAKTTRTTRSGTTGWRHRMGRRRPRPRTRAHHAGRYALRPPTPPTTARSRAPGRRPDWDWCCDRNGM